MRPMGATLTPLTSWWGLLMPHLWLEITYQIFSRSSGVL